MVEVKMLVLEEVINKPTKKVSPRVKEFRAGIDDGRAAAARDYTNEKVNLELFEEGRNFKDHYGTGFEIGYLTKLAEIAVY